MPLSLTEPLRNLKPNGRTSVTLIPLAEVEPLPVGDRQLVGDEITLTGDVLAGELLHPERGGGRVERDVDAHGPGRG